MSTPTPNDGGPAFPAYSRPHDGMSLHDWFAGMALQGFCANPDLTNSTSETLAAFAVEQADAMLASRERKEDER